MAAPGTSNMRFALTGPQYKQRLIAFESTSGALTQGKFDAVLSSGGTGTYVITFNEPFLLAPEVAVTCETDNRFARVTSSTTLAVTIETQDISGGAAADSDFMAIVHGTDSANAIK